MELTKNPGTEMEYWEAIEALGGYIWGTNHALSHGRIEDPNGEVSGSVTKARETQGKLAFEISEKFGVILPKDCPFVEPGKEKPKAPEGKIYYSDWYSKMKKAAYEAEYQGLLCSACPFSEGLERMIDLGGTIPCKAFSGSINRLIRPYLCAVIYTMNWTEEEHYSKVLELTGEEGLLKFLEKKNSLIFKFIKETNLKKE